MNRHTQFKKKASVCEKHVTSKITKIFAGNRLKQNAVYDYRVYFNEIKVFTLAHIY
jgi:hypothetical protein